MQSNKFSYTLEDMIAFSRVFSKKRMKWLWISLKVVLALCSAFFVYYIIMCLMVFKTERMLWQSSVLLVMCVVLILFDRPLTGLMFYLRLNKESNREGFYFAFEQDAIISKGSKMETRIIYDNIEGLYETHRLFLLSITRKSMFVIPKMAFENPGSVREFLKSKLSCEYVKFDF